MKFSQLFIKEIIFFSLFMPFFSSLVIAMEEEKTLVLPHPRKLYLGPLRNNSRKEEIGALIKEGVTLKFSNPTVHKLQEAIGLFEKAAEQGNIQGMFFIGKTCEEKGKLELAVRWYTLAFQNQWFQDPIGASKSLSYNSLKKLENEPRIEIQNFLMIHTFDIDSSVKKVGRYCSLIDFYKKKTAEPHLNDEQNQLKIKTISN